MRYVYFEFERFPPAKCKNIIRRHGIQNRCRFLQQDVFARRRSMPFALCYFTIMQF